MNSIDMNLLLIAAALFRSRNATKAAQELGVSQSAVSHALSRLRDHFQDPMFVRTSKGLAPTEFARGIQSDVLDVVHRSALLVARKKVFDPQEAVGRLTLLTTDYFEAVIMPQIQPVLAEEAPRLQISLRPTLGALPIRELEEGKADVAIAGFYADLPEGFYQVKLFTDTFQCAARKDHPTLSDGLSAEAFFNARHALITLQGDFKDRTGHWAGKERRERRIVYGSSSFTGVAWVLQTSDFILTAPRRLLAQYAKYFPIQIWEPPVDLGRIDVRMVWHSQTHQDPLRVWFRKRIREICQ